MTVPATYIFKQGDTVYKVAATMYGNPEPGWRSILAANDIDNPTTITPGQILMIPPSP